MMSKTCLIVASNYGFPISKTFYEKKILFNLIVLLICILSLRVNAQYHFGSLNVKEFRNPPQSSKIHVWWHWLDGNITKKGITKDLEAMKDQGIVQATIYNVGFFGIKNPEIAKVKFATFEWYTMFRWALQEASRLGITIGVNNSDGWNSGGPWITPEMSMKQFVFTKTIISGGEKISIKLNQPCAIQNFYKDIAVVAYKTKESLNSFQVIKPKISLNNVSDATALMDGDPVSAVKVTKGDFIQISFNKPFEFDKIALYPRKPFTWCNLDTYISKYTLLISDDGKKYTPFKDITVTGIRNIIIIPVPKIKAKFVRLSLAFLDEKDENWLPFTISEFELLKDDERATYTSDLPYVLEKTNSINSTEEKYFYQASTGTNETLQSKDVVILSERMGNDGTLNWDAPEGKWAILRFGYTSTGKMNNPATNEGRGLECDKMDSAAVDIHFNNFAQKLIDNAGNLAGTTFKFMLFDSWEAGFQNWTANFQNEFERRRGYSILPYVPLLCGYVINTSEESEAVLYDFRKTIAELIEIRYYGRYAQLCHRHKLQLYAEVLYGGADGPPLDILKTNSLIDVPMSEFWANGNFASSWSEVNLVSNVSNGYDKPIIAAEAYTQSAGYSESPMFLKPFGDRMYCEGINQFVLHDYAHQPNDDKPGMTLTQFGSNFNRNNLYWPYLSEWFNYQSRIQYLLQQGITTPDILYYLGDQLPQYYRGGLPKTLPFGYTQLVINFDLLKNRIMIKNGKLQLNEKGNYSLLCLSEYPFMNYETLQQIGTMVDKGAIVVGPKPLYQLNLTDIKKNKMAFNILADKIWGKIDGKNITDNRFGEGKVFWGIAIAEILNKIKLAPDFATNQSEQNIFQFIHKKLGDFDVYFVANQLNDTINRECLFRIEGKTPEVWNPENGTILKPAAFVQEKEQVRIPVSFKPYESKFFVFASGLPRDYITKITKEGIQLFPSFPGYSGKVVPLVYYENNFITASPEIAGEYIYYSKNGNPYPCKTLQKTERIITDFKGSVSFKAEYSSAIEPVEIKKLKSLTEFKNPDIRYFAGNATYTISFDAPANFSESKDSLLLNIGDFGVVAEVWLNGNQLGKIWKPFTDQNITGLLKNKNELVVKVANVYRNRFIGDFIQYGKVQNLWTSAPIVNILNKDKPLLSSGLIGPLRLTKYKKNYI